MSSTSQLDPIQPFDDFHAAAKAVLELLQENIGMGLWMVTRTEGNDWIVLNAADRGYGVQAGDVFRWSDSFCSRMVEGRGPRIASDSAQIQTYLEAPIGRQVKIGSYVGVPLSRPDGSLFGTLCAIDPEPQPENLEEQLPIVEVSARLLATILSSEMEREEQARRAEQAEAMAEVDALTGLYNRRGWDRLVDAEEKRCQRYGSPAGVVMLDLDALKETNDSQGHAAGDRLLQRTAEVLLATVRETDAVARIGGDEFAVLAPEKSALHLGQLERRLAQALGEAGVKASLGSARREPAGSLAAAQELADEQMYRNKRSADEPARARG